MRRSSSEVVRTCCPRETIHPKSTPVTREASAPLMSVISLERIFCGRSASTRQYAPSSERPCGPLCHSGVMVEWCTSSFCPRPSFSQTLLSE